MNNDAQEAAMGLLSLSPSNLPPPIPLVPLKRKHPPSSSGGSAGGSGSSSSSTVKRRPSSKLVHHQHPQQQHQPTPAPATDGDVSTEAISCICGSTFDDGFSIACDDCSRWCHAACFDIVAGEVPEEWRCWVCVPRPVDRERAVRLQRARMGLKVLEEQGPPVETTTTEQPQQPQRLDKKHRRTSAAALDGSSTTKRKRRASFLLPPVPAPAPAPGPPSHSTTTAAADDDPDVVVVDIDEPSSSSYVHITSDLVPAPETRAKLTRAAHSWRGITALSSFPPPTPSPPLPPPVAVHPLPPHPPHDAVRPPTYAVHTTAPVRSAAMIAPFTSTITPSAVYLSDPLNAYAHLGLPKPFVHLVGPPLDLALDARSAGGETRFVRSGCRPNAVLRPVLCRRQPRPRSSERERERASKSPQQVDSEAGNGTLAFAVFALRDLKANEEVVLGWEWDDGHAIHQLPALIQTPDLFPSAHQTHLRLQMSNILHLLSSTFPACACGAHARDCALRQMERFVEGLPFEGPPPPVPVRVEGESVEGRERVRERRTRGVDLGPLVGATRGFRTRERVVGSGGMGGVEMWDCDRGKEKEKEREDRGEGPSSARDVESHAEIDVEMVDVDEDETEDELELGRGRGRGRGRGWADTTPHPHRHRDEHPRRPQRHQRHHQHQLQRQEPLRPPDPPLHVPEPQLEAEAEAMDVEEKMPPKMRKRWIHREVEVRREAPVPVDEDRVVEWGWIGRRAEGREGRDGRAGDVVMEDGGERTGEEKENGERDAEVEKGALHSEAPRPSQEPVPLPWRSRTAMEAQDELDVRQAAGLLHPHAAASPARRRSPSVPLASPRESTPIPPTPRPAQPTISTRPPSPPIPPPLLSTDSPSASFARLSLISPVVSQLGRISTAGGDVVNGDTPSPRALQVVTGDLRGFVRPEDADEGGWMGEVEQIRERGEDDTHAGEEASEAGPSPMSDVTRSSPQSPSAPPSPASTASPAADALIRASPPATASPSLATADDDPVLVGQVAVPPTISSSSDPPDILATPTSPASRAPETYSSPSPFNELAPGTFPGTVDAVSPSTVAVHDTFSTRSSSPSRTAPPAGDTMSPASPLVEASPTAALAGGTFEISMDEDSTPESVVPPVEALFSPTPPSRALSPVREPTPQPSPESPSAYDDVQVTVTTPPPSQPEPETGTGTENAVESNAQLSPAPPVIYVRTPTPPPVPKVKMSLKDYALRKQKRKEEEKAWGAGGGDGGTVSVGGSMAGSAEASPVVETVGLGPEERELGTTTRAEERVEEGRVNGAVPSASKEPEVNARAAEAHLVVEQDEVMKDKDVEMEEVHYTPALILPPVVLPQPPSTTDVLYAAPSYPSTSKPVQNSSLFKGYPRHPTVPESHQRLPTQAQPWVLSTSRGLGAWRDRLSKPQTLATKPIRAPIQPEMSVPIPRWPGQPPPPRRHQPSPPLSSSSSLFSTTVGRATGSFTFQAKAELLEPPLPPNTSTVSVEPTPSQHHIQKVNGDGQNSSRPLVERIGPSTEPSPVSTPRQRQDPQEDGEVSLGEETPSPQPAPRRVRIDRTRFAPTTTKSPPTGPRALRSASPHHQSLSVPMQQSPPPSSSTPATQALPTARAPPTGPRAFRLGLAHQQQQQPRAPTPQGWVAMQRESWGNEWARSRPT